MTAEASGVLPTFGAARAAVAYMHYDPDRVYAAFRRDPATRDWLRIVHPAALQIRAASALVRSSYDIDSPIESDLEMLGRLLGAERTKLITVRYDSVIRFLQLSSEISGPPGALWNPTMYGAGEQYGQGQQYETGTQRVAATIVDLEVYRRYLRSRVLYNISDGTTDSILSVARELAQVDVGLHADDARNTIVLQFHGDVSPVVTELIEYFDVLPLPPLVRLDGWQILP